jgi:hypothetical protein
MGTENQPPRADTAGSALGYSAAAAERDKTLLATAARLSRGLMRAEKSSKRATLSILSDKPGSNAVVLIVAGPLIHNGKTLR